MTDGGSAGPKVEQRRRWESIRKETLCLQRGLLPTLTWPGGPGLGGGAVGNRKANEALRGAAAALTIFSADRGKTAPAGGAGSGVVT
ncbi:MAG: hypothetical protein AAGD06_15385 [Acidobacteriota bacterium]